MVIISPTGAVAKYCDECVCLSMTISSVLCVILTNFFVHVAYVRGSVLLRHVDDRPHRLSAGRGDRSAQRGQSVIYDWVV